MNEALWRVTYLNVPGGENEATFSVVANNVRHAVTLAGVLRARAVPDTQYDADEVLVKCERLADIDAIDGATFKRDRALKWVALVQAERERQIIEEGFDESHDDAADHARGEIVRMAIYYAGKGGEWPFGDEQPPYLGDKSMPRRLVIAGALLVAELERLERVAEAEGE